MKKNESEKLYCTESVKRKRNYISYFTTILGSIIYGFGVCWIIELGQFMTGGVTGTSQLIVGIFEKFGGSTSIRNYLGAFIALINIPLVLFGWRGVSRNFAILTIVSICVQSLSITLIGNLTVSPLAFLLENSSEGIIEAIKNGSMHIVKNEANIQIMQDFMENMKPGTRLLLAIIGGGVTGAGASICLKSGGSTGGMDVVANYLMMKKGSSFTKYQLTYDLTIIILSSLLSIENVLYTIVRLFVYIKIIDTIYRTYKHNRLEIITSKAEEIKKEVFFYFYHGMTIYDAIGGYTMNSKKVIEIFVSNYEIHDYIKLVKKIDPGAFIVSTKVNVIRSNYIQKTIV